MVISHQEDRCSGNSTIQPHEWQHCTEDDDNSGMHMDGLNIGEDYGI